MKRARPSRAGRLAGAALAAALLAGCGGGPETELAELGLRRVRIASASDDHGGFHGDGLEAVAARIEGGVEGLSRKPGWRPSPLPPGLARELFGGTEPGTGRVLGGALSRNALAAEAAQAAAAGGLFYFANMQASGPGRHDIDAFVLADKSSCNLVLCVVDATGRACWYFRLDT